MRPVIIAAVAALSLSACTDAGSPHGYAGQFSGWSFDVNGVPTIVPDGASPMGSRVNPDGSEEDMYSTFASGTVQATGRAAVYAALSLLCTAAPQAGACQ